MRPWQRLRRPFRRAPHGGVLRLSPPEVLLIGFALLCTLGALLLWLPGSATRPLAWHEALFTATSAVTVTGLSVIDVSQDLTFVGQLVLLVLIQIGGLGFMTFAALTVLLLGARLPLQQQNLVREALGEIAFSDVRHLVKLVIWFALCIEGIGTLLLAIHWVPEYGLKAGLWDGLFHAVSAFNNAGFSTWKNSLSRDVDDPLVTVVITVLFIVGGLGFVVVSDIYRQRRWSRLAMQTKVVLLATLWLNVIATLILLALEWSNPGTLGALGSDFARLQAAWFQAVTPRTAGFNTLDTGSLRDASTLLVMLLMFIGGGASSTASGIKITTFVVLLLTARAFYRNTEHPTAFGRSIPQETVIKAITVALAGVLLVFLTLFGLTITDSRQHFIDLAFETVSAFGTVGLSRGITSDLSLPGQLLLGITMLLGRVGPLSVGYFLATRQSRGVRYAKGDIQIG
ncbi:TrkH family potassium uptake protein [Salinicola rhizosphaerae]|uniref:Ktr system potassium uptake protein B n=1 Tax=Salinicola rhizosphaerae TaxID=1443141 RepID=A0ABQ3E900_9GAMM|nr:TrkH family potassium uptake protein [Salinicola rhizosphaerae]GHB27132.1 ktr system potassium uptake protein B [Salinicola rhizosphaerae]